MLRLTLERRVPLALLVLLLPLSVACGSSIRGASTSLAPAVASPSAAPAMAQAAPQAPVEDPVLVLIATSDRHFKAGEKALELGHVEAARQEFDQAVTVFLESS